jgi:hypothetical protein
MKFRIHFELSDGTEDSIVVCGETVEDIRDKANAEVTKRTPHVADAWSEEIREEPR